MPSRLILGDCLAVLPTLESGSVDAVVTDPPYDLAFMNKGWDRTGVAFRPETWAAVAGPLKPGGVLMAFGGTRTFHRLACAIEDAGFKIQDTLCWLYGQGFPKHKAHLKPAWEPIILARKAGPLWLGVEECRLEYQGDADKASATPQGRCTAKSGALAGGVQHDGEREDFERPELKGRWPANVALSHTPECRCVGTKRVKGTGPRKGGDLKIRHEAFAQDEYSKTAFVSKDQPGFADADGMEEVEAWECHPDCPVRLLDEQSGESKSSGGVPKSMGAFGNNGVYGKADGVITANAGGLGDTGGASRFFYCAKASKRDRGEGNTHPTVKPTDLMEWLVKLACPPGGLILDPFAGSGTTLLAAARTGREGVGIEQDPAYHAIAERRLREDFGPLFAQ